MCIEKLYLIFLEASLERVPSLIAKHPVILRDARRRGKKAEKILLDDSRHHAAMKKLDRREKRGRPDILHLCLLSALDSRARHMEVYIHTIEDKIIWLNSQTRLPRNYNRFVGLMEDLFEKKVIAHSGIDLMKFSDVSLDELLDALVPSKIVLMHEAGEKKSLKDLFSRSVAVCIGAFPHGDFENKTLDVLRRHNALFVSLGGESFTSLYVTNRILCIYEEAIRCENSN
jgi:rRNA small subunit pseudouridine methyltransferase Nep1